MLYNTMGFEIEVNLPQNIQQADQRLQEIKILRLNLLKKMDGLQPKDPKRKALGQDLQKLNAETTILKSFRTNAHLAMNVVIADSSIVDSKSLTTEAGLIKHLYLQLRTLMRDNSIESRDNKNLKAVMDAAHYWLLNELSMGIKQDDYLKPLIEKERRRKASDAPPGTDPLSLRKSSDATDSDREETKAALDLLSEFARKMNRKVG